VAVGMMNVMQSNKLFVLVAAVAATVAATVAGV
jgi:hypothetical protein